ncbi:MAG: hypothetical protein ACJAVM_000996 [Sulfitobacter sp.]|jgi:hypothetical protein
MVVVFVALVSLPAAIWMDLKTLSDENLRRQATSLNGVISSVRSYYAVNVVSRVIRSDAKTQALHNYLDVSGAIPIPATLSLELGAADPAAPVFFKGLAREVTPYHVRALADVGPDCGFEGMDQDGKLTLDLNALDDRARAWVRAAIKEAMTKAQT